MGEQVADDEDDDDEDVRRSKDSANRNLASLKAALNRALKHRMISTDFGWRTVPAFPKVGARRKDAFLTLDARRTLLDNCPLDLRQLCEALLHTGARPGEVANMNVGDFDQERNVITLTGKTGPRTVPVSEVAAKFFRETARDKSGNAPMLATAYGQRWNKDAWKDLFRKACVAGALPKTVVMYSLRHTAISEFILGGLDVYIAATITGTSVEMIERNYGHLRHEAVRPKLNAVTMF